MALLSVRRPILPLDHARLREHMPDTNRLGDFSIKWLRFKEPGVTLIHPAQYLAAVRKQAGKLAAVDTVQLADEFNKMIIPGMPDGNARLTAPVIDVDFYGEGRFRSIAYVLGSEALDTEWSRLTAELDDRNEVKSEWDPFESHITVATIPAEHAANNVLEAFWDFAPDNIALQKIVAQAV